MNERRYFNLSYDNQKKEAQKLIEDLAGVLKKIGINVEVAESMDDKNEKKWTWLVFDYDPEKVLEKFSRRAGKKEKWLTKEISPQEVRERMAAGESAEKIAVELGISRVTLFRRLKSAEKNFFDEL